MKKEERSFWRDLCDSWEAVATCLIDRWFWEDLGRAAGETLKGITVLGVKVLATLTFPLTGLFVALIVRQERQKRLAAHEQIVEALKGNRQKL